MGSADSRLRADVGGVLQVQTFSTHDGDGLRTVIFLAGCPLRCAWCANPESWTPSAQRAFYRGRCRGCGACRGACPQGLDPRTGRDSRCTDCGRCITACPHRALARLGGPMSAEAVTRKVMRDAPFFAYSGGGVTFSGGEPTAQPGFLRTLAERLDDLAVDMWIETCGFFDYDEVADIFARLSHVFFDLKLMDSRLHAAYTGQPNDVILVNARRIYASGLPLTFRVPCVPGVSLTDENLAQTAAFIRQMPGAEVELLPYHRLGEEKYAALRLPPRPSPGFTPPTTDAMSRAEDYLRAAGVRVASYR
jgi:pyruvate formate lyase activating enzyme